MLTDITVIITGVGIILMFAAIAVMEIYVLIKIIVEKLFMKEVETEHVIKWENINGKKFETTMNDTKRFGNGQNKLISFSQINFPFINFSRKNIFI